jgi:hypothetical protein
MTYDEIAKNLSFEKTKLMATKLLCARKKLIIVISSPKQHGAQINN